MATVNERVAVTESRLDHVEQTVGSLETAMYEVRLTERELRTNWRLAIALGGLAGTLFVGLMLMIAGGG